MTIPSVCGVVVTYQPEPDAVENLTRIVTECRRVIVVDNASSAPTQARLVAVPGVELIALLENRGVAAALNVGVRRARELGYDWVVTFDQDSQPEKGMVAALWEAHLRNPRAAVVGPCIVESARHGRPYRWVRRHPNCGCFFQRVKVQASDLAEVTEIITSGSMVELATWEALGGFDDALFIDYVDVDYCLRVGRANRSVMVAAAARLQHRLGARRPARLLGKDFRPMHHPAFRHYYMARNRVRLWRRHAFAVPHWAAFDFCFAMFNGFRVLAFETEKWAKLRAIILGTWDGILGRSGPCPPSRRRAFDA